MSQQTDECSETCSYYVLVPILFGSGHDSALRVFQSLSRTILLLALFSEVDKACCLTLADDQRTSAYIHKSCCALLACALKLTTSVFLPLPRRLVFTTRHSFVFEPRYQYAMGFRWPMMVVQIRGEFIGPSTTILLTTLFNVRKHCRIPILISELSWLAPRGG